MKNNTAITTSPIAKGSAGPLPEISLGQREGGWTGFWFTPVAPVGLHVLRVLAGVLFIAWLLPLGGQVAAFYGLDGWFDRLAYNQAREIARQAELPPEDPMTNPPENVPFVFGWSLLYLAGSNTGMLKAMYWLAITVFALFALGLWPRLSAILTWVFVGSFLASPAVNYDADYLLIIPAFYLMIGYFLLGQWNSQLTPGERILGPRSASLASFFLGRKKPEAPSYAANLALRLLQVHFAIVVVVSGLHKLQSGEWWSGVALWFPLHPPFEATAENLRTDPASASFHLFALSLAQYIVLAWQIGFPLFAWKKRWRVVLLGGAAVGWIGSFYLYRQPLFGPVYFLCSLSYLTAGEWQGITSRLGQLWERLAGGLPAVPEKKVKVRTGVHG